MSRRTKPVKELPVTVSQSESGTSSTELSVCSIASGSSNTLSSISSGIIAPPTTPATSSSAGFSSRSTESETTASSSTPLSSVEISPRDIIPTATSVRSPTLIGPELQQAHSSSSSEGCSPRSTDSATGNTTSTSTPASSTEDSPRIIVPIPSVVGDILIEPTTSHRGSKGPVMPPMGPMFLYDQLFPRLPSRRQPVDDSSSFFEATSKMCTRRPSPVAESPSSRPYKKVKNTELADAQVPTTSRNVATASNMDAQAIAEIQLPIGPPPFTSLVAGDHSEIDTDNILAAIPHDLDQEHVDIFPPIPEGTKQADDNLSTSSNTSMDSSDTTSGSEHELSSKSDTTNSTSTSSSERTQITVELNTTRPTDSSSLASSTESFVTAKNVGRSSVPGRRVPSPSSLATASREDLTDNLLHEAAEMIKESYKLTMGSDEASGTHSETSTYATARTMPFQSASDTTVPSGTATPIPASSSSGAMPDIHTPDPSGSATQTEPPIEESQYTTGPNRDFIEHVLQHFLDEGHPMISAYFESQRVIRYHLMRRHFDRNGRIIPHQAWRVPPINTDSDDEPGEYIPTAPNTDSSQ